MGERPKRTLLPPRKPNSPERTGGRSFLLRFPPDSPPLPLPLEPGVLRPEFTGDCDGDCLPPWPPPTPCQRQADSLEQELRLVNTDANTGARNMMIASWCFETTAVMCDGPNESCIQAKASTLTSEACRESKSVECG